MVVKDKHGKQKKQCFKVPRGSRYTNQLRPSQIWTSKQIQREEKRLKIDHSLSLKWSCDAPSMETKD